MADDRRNRIWGRMLGFVLTIGLVWAAMGTVSSAADDAAPENASAEEEVLYRNDTTGYEVFLHDQAEILSDREAEILAEQMKQITAYGNVVFWSVQDNQLSVDGYAEAHYRNLYGDQSGILVLIDLGKGKAGIYCTGRVARAFGTRERARLADSLKKSVRNGNYASVARTIFSRAFAAVEGEMMARVTKYAGNALIALILAMLINFVAVNLFSGLRRTRDSELLEQTLNYFDKTMPEVEYVTSMETYAPHSAKRAFEVMNRKPF